MISNTATHRYHVPNSVRLAVPRAAPGAAPFINLNHPENAEHLIDAPV